MIYLLISKFSNLKTMQSKVTLIRHWVTILLLCLTTSPLSAQTLNVKGKVTDANKEPLMLKG